MMKIIFSLVLLLGVQAFGRILSSLDPEWQDYSSQQKTISMLGSAGREVEMDLNSHPTLKDEPYVTKNVHFYLYTKEHDIAYQIKNDDAARLKSSTFNPSRKTKVLIHGFLNNYQKPIDMQLSAAYLKNQDVNILLVDWSKLAAGPNYDQAVGYTLPVGQEVAIMVDLLVSAGGANVSDVHILGHSLGAHVASFTANHVTSGRITRITGLDPALPLFGDRPPAGRLDPLDADIVDCIHTCGGYLGFYVPLCTHDFYANGGTPIQPGCGFDFFGSCSHSRSFNYYAASIAGYKFPARACSSFQQVQTDFCTGKWTGLLGELAATTPPGLYYLKTSGSYPYTT